MAHASVHTPHATLQLLVVMCGLMLTDCLSLLQLSFLPSFLSSLIYTLFGSYTWYWACLGGKNVGCCLLWIKILVGFELINVLLQVSIFYRFSLFHLLFFTGFSIIFAVFRRYDRTV